MMHPLNQFLCIQLWKQAFGTEEADERVGAADRLSSTANGMSLFRTEGMERLQ